MAAEAVPLIDALQVADLMALDRGRGAVYKRFVDAFLSGAGGRIAELKALAGSGDAIALAAAAHALMGSSSNVGAARLAALFGRIEAAGKKGDLAAAGKLLNLLDEEHAAAREALLKLVNGD